MFESIIPLKNKYLELAQRLEMPETYLNQEFYSMVEKNFRELEPIVLAYCDYCKIEEDIQKVQVLFSDDEMKSLALAEYESLKKEREIIIDKINGLLIPEDPDADRNVIIEIRGGVGGEESSLFAADLFRMYSMYCDKKGWKIDVFNSCSTELGGLKEISFSISGKGVFSRMKFEAGTHRVQRIPVTESGGRIHTSAATVAVLPEVGDVDFSLNMNDVKIDTYRSSGAGGQHVNKTESAIRVTHIPTGTVVECQDERSQYKNKDRALSILRARLYEAEKQKQISEYAAERKTQVGSGDRSERIRTYNFPQSRVTDHRLNGDIRNFNINSIIDGDLDCLIDCLLHQERAEKLANTEK